MKVRTQDYNDVTVFELQGELDGEFTELFKNTVTGIIGTSFCKKTQNGNPIGTHKAGIVLDMSGVGTTINGVQNINCNRPLKYSR